MLRDPEVIKIYNKRITYMPTSRYRFLAREISYFYKKYNYIDVADLISQLVNDEEMIATIGEIETLNLKENYTKDEINDYINAIFEYNIKNEIMKYLRKVNEFMIRYIYCRLIDAAIMFFVSYFALLIFDIPYPFVLAAIVSVFNIVPYIGSILSTIILIIVTLFTSGISQGILVGIVMFILQQIDGNVIAPFLIKDRLKLNPVLVLVAVILGGGFGGIVGIMLGVPLAAVIRLIANDLMRRHEIIAKYKARHNGNPPTAYFGMNTGTVQTNHSSQLCVKNENNQKTTV